MKAVIYARFSPRPNAHESMSIATQLDRARQYCAAHGHAIAGEFTDEATSGKDTARRPGLQAAMRAVLEMGEEVTLVVYSLSRLARSVKDALLLAEDLDDAGANLTSLSEQIDTSTAMGRAFFHILAVLAELERELVVERTRDAMLRHQAAGRRMSALPPYGWRAHATDAALLVRDEHEQAVISRILDLSAAGLSDSAISRLLNKDSVPCRTCGWYPRIVGRLVRRARRDARLAVRGAVAPPQASAGT